MPFIFDIQPLESDDLKEQALARLSEVDKYIDTNVANLKKGLELGYSSPRLTVEAVPEEVRALRDESSPFLAISTRAGDEVFEGKVQAIFADEIVPAINRYADFIEDEYLDEAREVGGQILLLLVHRAGVVDDEEDIHLVAAHRRRRGRAVATRGRRYAGARVCRSETGVAAIFRRAA